MACINVKGLGYNNFVMFYIFYFSYFSQLCYSVVSHNVSSGCIHLSTFINKAGLRNFLLLFIFCFHILNG